MFHDPANGAALSGGVPALEQDNQPLAHFSNPVLELDQFHLEGQFLGFVLAGPHLLRVGVQIFAEVPDPILSADVGMVFYGFVVRDGEFFIH